MLVGGGKLDIFEEDDFGVIERLGPVATGEKLSLALRRAAVGELTVGRVGLVSRVTMLFREVVMNT